MNRSRRLVLSRSFTSRQTCPLLPRACVAGGFLCHIFSQLDVYFRGVKMTATTKQHTLRGRYIVRPRFIIFLTWLLVSFPISIDVPVSYQQPIQATRLNQESRVIPAVYRTWKWWDSRLSLRPAVELKRYRMVAVCPPDALSVWLSAPPPHTKEGGVF